MVNLTTIRRDCYKVLGVKPTDSGDAIKAAYRNLAKKYHPDVNHDVASFCQDVLKDAMSAYEILGNALQRKEYDGLSIFQWRVPAAIRNGAVPLELPKKSANAPKEHPFLDKMAKIFLGIEKKPEKNAHASMVYLALGLTIAQAGDPSLLVEAQANFEKAAAYDETNVYALFNYGLALYKSGMFDRALTTFRKVERLAPRDQDCGRLIALLSEAGR